MPATNNVLGGYFFLEGRDFKGKKGTEQMLSGGWKK